MSKHERTGILTACTVLLLGAAISSHATVGMHKQAKAAGVKVGSCLDCHAAPHSKEVMEKRAHDVGFLISNCQGCHGGKFPSKLSPAGEWLVEQKKAKGAKEVDGAWLKDYVPAKPGEARKE